MLRTRKTVYGMIIASVMMRDICFGGGVMDIKSGTPDFGLVQDVRSLNRLRDMGRDDSYEARKQALYTAAEQFESLLNQFWFRGMRESNDEICPDSPLKTSDGGVFQSMLDEQIITGVAKANAGNRSSITNLLVKQFARSLGDDGKKIIAEIDGNPADSKYSGTAGDIPGRQNFVAGASGMPSPLSESPLPDHLRMTDARPDANIHANNEVRDRILDMELGRRGGENRIKAYSNTDDTRYDSDMTFDSPRDFVTKLMPLARKVARKFGLNPVVIVCQAALETGWGKHIGADNNFFGIKGNSSWKGRTAVKSSPEFENGRMVNELSSFRAYNSPRKSFEDYASLISTNTRYAKAASVSSDPDQYFEEIQKAGYATDPNYAKKLKRIYRNDAFSGFTEN